MKTSQPLRALVPSMIQHIQDHSESHIKYNAALIKISNGSLLPFVEESMKDELNERAFERSKQRIPPVNILNKLQTKLSKVYGETPVRSAGENSVDNEIMDEYVKSWGLDENLQYANDLLVINKYCALEPYQIDGEPRMRVLTAKDFIVFSDSTVNPSEMTVFIKFMGLKEKQIERDVRGKKVDSIRQVSMFYAYSEDEFLVFDEEGEVHDERVNPHGKIPFVYIRTSTNELIPTPDSDNLPMATLIPKLMADLNYAVMFGCRSQVVGIDVEMDNIEASPDSMWILNSIQGEGTSPSIDTIKSDVDVDKVLNLINTELSLWLDTKGIKTSGVGKATIENAASGISKLIDESDASAVNRKYKRIFNNAERNLFKLLPDLHDTWIQNGESDMIRGFSTKYDPMTELVDTKIMPDNRQLLEEMQLEKDLGIFDKEKALRRLNPDANDTEIEMMKNSININESVNPEQNNDGDTEQ